MRFAQLSILLLGPPFIVSNSLAQSKGENDYLATCAPCHGKTGQGNGQVKTVLPGLNPADLTTLSERNGGQFPSDEVYRAIDGRDQILGHEKRRMPMWGLNFQKEDEEFTPLSEAEVKRRISDLVDYIRTLQRK